MKAYFKGNVYKCKAQFIIMAKNKKYLIWDMTKDLHEYYKGNFKNLLKTKKELNI